MRKLTAVIFALLITTTAFAAPNDSSERGPKRGAVAKIIRAIKHIIGHPMDLEQPGTPIPTTTTP